MASSIAAAAVGDSGDCEAKRSQTSKPQYGGSSVFEESFYNHFTQEKEAGCKEGCKLYHTCMQKYE